LDHCSERVQTSNFLSATVLSCRESNSHRRRGCDTDRTRQFCCVWRGGVSQLFIFLSVGRERGAPVGHDDEALCRGRGEAAWRIYTRGAEKLDVARETDRPSGVYRPTRRRSSIVHITRYDTIRDAVLTCSRGSAQSTARNQQLESGTTYK